MGAAVAGERCDIERGEAVKRVVGVVAEDASCRIGGRGGGGSGADGRGGGIKVE